MVGTGHTGNGRTRGEASSPNQGHGAGGSLWLTVAPGWDRMLGLKPFSTSVSPESKWRKFSPRELYLHYSAGKPGSSCILEYMCVGQD